MAVWDLEKKRSFLVHQLVRLTSMSKSSLENKSLNELEMLEKDYYEKKHPLLKGQPDYKPATF